MGINFVEKYKVQLFFKISSIVILCNIIISLFFEKITTSFNIVFKSKSFSFESKTEEFILVVIVAPIFETFIFQYLPNFYLRKYNVCYTILISSFLFGLAHNYSYIYILYGFIVGLLFISAYVFSIKEKINPFLIICYTHFIYNLFAFCMNNFI